MNQNLKEKEDIVQKEIIDKGYDIDDFKNYIITTMHVENVDFNNWTIDEISKSIKDFQENKINTKDNLNIDTLNDENEEYLAKGDYIKTKKQPQSKLTDCLDATVNISECEKISNGFFSFTKFLFTIECPELNSKNKRSFSDFQWLKKKLEIFYPNIYIPPLPQISFFHKYTDKYINKQGRYLNKFLNSLIQNITIRSSEIFIDFLSLDEEEYKKKVLEYEKLEPPESLKKIKTFEQKIKISSSKDKDIKADQIRNIILQRDKAYKNLNLCLKSLTKSFDIVSERMVNVSKSIKELQKYYDGNVKNIFINYENITKNWGDTYIKQKGLFKEYFKECFQYIHNYNLDFLNFYDKYQQSKYNFVCEYLQYDDISTIKEEKQNQINKLRKYYGYYLNRFIDEFYKLDNITTFQGLKLQSQLIFKNKEIFYEDYLNLFNTLKEAFISNEETEKKTN